MLFIEKCLPLADHSEIFIIKDTADDRKLLQNCGSQLLNVHLHAAVTGNGDDRCVRITDLGTDSTWKAVTHGSKSAGHDQLTVFGDVRILAHQHLMLTYIGNKNGFVKLAVDLTDDIQRSHHTTVFHGKRMIFFPFLDLFQPFFSVALLYIFIHFCDGLFCIGNDGDIYMNISGNGSSVHVNMYNFCFWCKFIQISGNTVVKSCSDGK